MVDQCFTKIFEICDQSTIPIHVLKCRKILKNAGNLMLILGSVECWPSVHLKQHRPVDEVQSTVKSTRLFPGLGMYHEQSLKPPSQTPSIL